MAVNTLLGATLAGFNLRDWILAFVITSCVLLVSHFINAWRDFVKGLDRVEGGSRVKPYTVASQVLPRGWLSLRVVKVSALAFLLLSFILVLLFAPRRFDLWILYCIGVAIALTYTDFFKPRGLGEIALFLGHGFGTTTFAYSFVKPINAEAISAGVLLGVFASVCYTIDQYQDVETDFARRVKNLAYLVFKANMRISQLWWFLVTASLTMQAGLVLMGWLPSKTMLTVFCLPLAHVVGILLDYDFSKGVLIGLLNMWLYALLMALGVLVF